MMSMITIKEQCDNAWKMINSGDLIGAEHVANAMLTGLGKNPEKNDDLFLFDSMNAEIEEKNDDDIDDNVWSDKYFSYFNVNGSAIKMMISKEIIEEELKC